MRKRECVKEEREGKVGEGKGEERGELVENGGERGGGEMGRGRRCERRKGRCVCERERQRGRERKKVNKE